MQVLMSVEFPRLSRCGACQLKYTAKVDQMNCSLEELSSPAACHESLQSLGWFAQNLHSSAGTWSQMRWNLNWNALSENTVNLPAELQTPEKASPTPHEGWVSSLFHSCMGMKSAEVAKGRVVWALLPQELYEFLKWIVWKMMVHKFVRLKDSSLPSVSIADMLTVYMEFMCPFTLLFMGKYAVTLQLPHHMLLILPQSYRAPSSRKYTYIKRLCIFKQHCKEEIIKYALYCILAAFNFSI